MKSVKLFFLCLLCFSYSITGVSAVNDSESRHPTSSQSKKRIDRSNQLESRGVPTFLEFAEIYVKDYLPVHKKEITVLYPGSGGDMAPLFMAGRILELANDIEQIRLIYCEIGGAEIFGEKITDISWHDGLDNLAEQIKSGLEEYNLEDNVEIVNIENRDSFGWARTDIPGSCVLEFSMKYRLETNHQKNISLLLCYNIFDNRKDFSTKERELFSREYLQFVRRGYWTPDPQYKLKIYPTYFIQEQFETADILLCDSPGDPFLLIFDYVRALIQMRSPESKVFLIDWGWNEKFEISRILREEFNFFIKKRGLKNTQFGDCRTESCKPQMIYVLKNTEDKLNPLHKERN